MNTGRYYIPNYMPYYGFTPRQGLLGRMIHGLHSVNWSGLLNNANKTINVVKETIPLVRQAAPMFKNFKSMMRIAKAFNKETNNNKTIIKKQSINNNESPNFFL